MTELKDSAVMLDTAKEQSDAPARSAADYVPPAVTPVGNLRNLVAGVNGTQIDDNFVDPFTP